jgi:monoamine oxidase
MLGQGSITKEPYDGQAAWEKYRAPDAIAEEVHRQLRLAYGLAPDQIWPGPPRYVVYRDWTADPFGGECHAWRAGERSDEIRRRLIRLDPSAPVHVCGEAYSTFQGWVEGALESADYMLEQVFDLPPLHV